LIALYDSHDRNTMLWSFGLFGIFMLPLYALSVAHANDRMPKGGYVEASATLLLINSIASVIGPTFAASVMDLFGARALFFFTASVHSCMLVFTLFRLTQKSRPPMQEHFTPLPPEASPSTLELVAPKHDPAP
jgi:MFS family permease